jgi:branched-chain amino acid aminotransferase
MRECARPYYILDGKVRECHTLDEDLVHKGISLYEVIRLVGGKFLFLDDHLSRLHNSLALSRIPSWVSGQDIRETLQVLVDKNHIGEGNVKVVMNLQEDGRRHFLAYFVYHRYPVPRNYHQGVHVITYPFERLEPNKKIWRPEFRRHVAKTLHDAGAFEALLMDSGKCITEASKANVFAIRGDRVITPPENVILPGITRYYVLQICQEQSLHVEMEKIPFEELTDIDGLFLTGTSLHVLPVSSVNDHTLPVHHPVQTQIMNSFQELVNKHLN